RRRRTVRRTTPTRLDLDDPRPGHLAPAARRTHHLPRPRTPGGGPRPRPPPPHRTRHHRRHGAPRPQPRRPLRPHARRHERRTHRRPRTTRRGTHRTAAVRRLRPRREGPARPRRRNPAGRPHQRTPARPRVTAPVTGHMDPRGRPDGPPVQSPRSDGVHYFAQAAVRAANTRGYGAV